MASSPDDYELAAAPKDRNKPAPTTAMVVTTGNKPARIASSAPARLRIIF
jgi:hypothetical protein